MVTGKLKGFGGWASSVVAIKDTPPSLSKLPTPVMVIDALVSFETVVQPIRRIQSARVRAVEFGDTISVPLPPPPPVAVAVAAPVPVPLPVPVPVAVGPLVPPPVVVPLVPPIPPLEVDSVVSPS